MAELASIVAGSVLEKLGSVAFDEVSLAWGMKKDLKKLEEKTLMLKSVLKDAEKKQARDVRLKMWLLRLKDVFDDAVNVLDEFECEELRRQVVREYGSVGGKVRRLFSRSNPIAFRFSIAHKVKEVRIRLDEIATDMAQFQLIRAELNGREEQSHLIDQEKRDRMTHSFVKASEVIGRDSDKAQIIDMLLRQDDSKSDDNLSVIPIVGIGGLGKTTLAKSVYNDETVDRKFDLKLWVCVSLDFNVTELVREILKSATKSEQDIGSMSIDQLQTSLRSILEGKKFLLVLDDVWNDNRSKWLNLREFLTAGAEGSKVIVTTRNTSVSSIMTKTPPYQLRGLSKEDSLSLFFKCAFGDEQLERRYPRLKDIGKEIVKKCGGVPLALKTLGNLLYSKTEADWIRVRDSEIWKLEQDDILPALRLSYDAMSPCMKQCFAYCSTFPEDAIMNSFELIAIWMALGILQSPNEEMELEDIGLLQFKGLCARSFFQYNDYNDDDYTVYGLFYDFDMHDLIQGLACSITESECYIAKSGKENIPESVRHLRIFLKGNNDLIVLKRFKKLWSIHIDCIAKKGDIDEFFLSTCIAQLRYLRIFDLKELSFKVLPSSIGTLKHLRYLNLTYNKKIKRLPDSICKLQSLQTLSLAGCTELEELPRGISNLVSLRILFVTVKQIYFSENGVGRLKSLRTLFIKECENLRSLPHDMKYCTTLRTLLIGDCKQLDLATKPDEAVINLSLQHFAIFELHEMRALPQWLKGASNTLKLLVIEECDKLVTLPEWLPNLVSLQKLVIKKCEELLGLPDGMERLTSLAYLRIEDCKQLNLASGDNEFVQLKLQTIKIRELPQTTNLPQWLQGASDTLQLLEIDDFPKLVALPEWLSNFASLETLTIERCPRLTSLLEGMKYLASLTDLKIRDCEQLKLASESNKAVQLSLQSFYISGLPLTTNLPQWLQGATHTLKHLVIKHCPKLNALPEWLPNCVSLQELVINSCLELSSLPEGMSRLKSLTHLTIRWANTALHERCKPEIGEDWANIAHVPNIHIYP